ncbi:uncharacterized protein BX664DRAFT_323892 [Halteromyces radiatus]|uniref:uncharacterized protein n=1 Tax=Halteromyces radiatus TaxID=101107 RepID=UPI0022203C6A|nr:uncharacterized protein BX664DRAFT_323892 [Halteromyces radiatus]KAI8096389.1 hypothetical protein BX664DRAFT_323892 [Halteromyces radiatus]
MPSEPGLSIKDASGRQISLLNDSPPPSSSSFTTRRRYHCTEPGCNKSFTTSGHLARHNRIHTGEKNFHCLYPGCPSRFSRQDNMMQHYRTHMSPKSRRHPYHHRSYPFHEKKIPQLHRHTHIQSETNDLQPLNQSCFPTHTYLPPPAKHHPLPPMNYQHRHEINSTQLNNDSHKDNERKDESSDLLQLAYIVSTFG